MSAAKDAFYGDPNNRPPSTKCIEADVPASIRNIPQWVGWYYRWKTDRKKARAIAGMTALHMSKNPK